MIKNMELKEGVRVFTADGKQVGAINRFILDPATNEVTHIVVQKGWLLPEDKVVPLHMLDSATEEKIILTKDVADFNELPPFEETHYIQTMDDDFHQTQVPSDESVPSYYWYPPRGYIGYPAYSLDYHPWPPIEETTRNIPEHTIPLKEGANVMSADGKHVGDVERLFVEPRFNRATHFLITQGLLLKERKLVPTSWIKSVEEDKVQLTVSEQMLKRLPAYEP
jgi:uncharacterized protein YrrD